MSLFISRSEVQEDLISDLINALSTLSSLNRSSYMCDSKESLNESSITDIAPAAASQTTDPADITSLDGRFSIEDNLCKCLKQVKSIVMSPTNFTSSLNPSNSMAEAKIVSFAMLLQRMTKLLLDTFTILPSEGRKDATLFINHLIRRNMCNFATEYLVANISIVYQLVDMSFDQETYAACGSMLRECVKYNDIVMLLLKSKYIWFFFDTFVHSPNFDVATDAFNTLREILLLSFKPSYGVSLYIAKEFVDVMSHYQLLLSSSNYVTKRRSLKLLGELLLHRQNFNTMSMYISSAVHLKTIMNLLRDKSPCIRIESYHIFKIFVANPKKSDEVRDILLKNQSKLVIYLNGLSGTHSDEVEDTFLSEKQFIIDTLISLT